ANKLAEKRKAHDDAVTDWNSSQKEEEAHLSVLEQQRLEGKDPSPTQDSSAQPGSSLIFLGSINSLA
ncbi:hypothetical protein H671_1g2875, partial [Cricetulus griseus]